MTTLDSVKAPRRPGLSGTLPVTSPLTAKAALILLGAAPVVGVAAYRALPLLCGLALALLAASGDWRQAPTRLRMSGDRLWGQSLALLLLVAALSLGWSVRPGPAAVNLAVVILFCALGALAWASRPTLRPADLGLAIGIGMVPAAVLILYEMHTAMQLHVAFGGTSVPSKMNQAAVLMALWIWPALRLLQDRSGRGVAIALLLIAGAGILGSHSETARLAFRVSLLAFALNWLGWRSLPLLLGVALALFMLVQPWLMAALHSFMPQAVLETFKSGHAAERLVIWTSFSHAVGLWPFAGVGFDGSGLIGFGPRLMLFPEALWTGIRDSHPHNMFLQVWVELGLLGALPLALFLYRGGVVVSRMPWRRLRPYGTAVLVALPIVALVGYGAWQAWWIASFSVLPVLFEIAGRLQPESQPGAGEPSPPQAPAPHGEPERGSPATA